MNEFSKKVYTYYETKKILYIKCKKDKENKIFRKSLNDMKLMTHNYSCLYMLYTFVKVLQFCTVVYDDLSSFLMNVH